MIRARVLPRYNRRENVAEVTKYIKLSDFLETRHPLSPSPLYRSLSYILSFFCVCVCVRVRQENYFSGSKTRYDIENAGNRVEWSRATRLAGHAIGRRRRWRKRRTFPRSVSARARTSTRRARARVLSLYSVKRYVAVDVRTRSRTARSVYSAHTPITVVYYLNARASVGYDKINCLKKIN